MTNTLYLDTPDFVEELPGSGRSGRLVWEERLAPLQSKPNTWAVVAEAYNGSSISTQMTGIKRILVEGGSYEACTRRDKETGVERGYARFVPNTPTAQPTPIRGRRTA